MPKTRAARVKERPQDPVLVVRDVADALYRSAAECCHQHEHLSVVLAKAVIDEEIAAAQRLCQATAGALQSLVERYERESAGVRPGGADETWWKRANTLWLASRDYVRRHQGCDDSTGDLKNHGPGRLETLLAEYELEASAVLSLRQAADGYRQDRPDAA